MNSVNVSRVEPDGMGRLRLYILVCEEVVRAARRSRHVAGSLQAEHQQVVYQAVVLDDKGGELQSADYTVRIGVIHVLNETDNNTSKVRVHLLNRSPEHTVKLIQAS